MFPDALEFHVAEYVNNGINWLLHAYAPTFDSISAGISFVLMSIQGGLSSVPWWGYILLVATLAWVVSKRISTVLILVAMLMLIGMFGLWQLAIDTLAVIITAVILSLIFGIPLGILMAEVDLAKSIMKPILDGMQTMPSFVYLIPAMMFFGLGKVPAVFATLIYSMPPVIRLTDLGLRQVPKSTQEAALAYGCTKWQLLKEVRVPLAMPNIMAGINQTTMMALAMVVVCSMIGARGLGQEVLLSINRIDVGHGFESGFSIVILAIVIDRITQGFARRWDPNKR
ncbi:MAG: proline/glycine betaine ABC transporter permease [Synergistales bacterium]|nr:proline/glycine betaine ABC transporter permease [Synergistales bacterium]